MHACCRAAKCTRATCGSLQDQPMESGEMTRPTRRTGNQPSTVLYSTAAAALLFGFCNLLQQPRDRRRGPSCRRDFHLHRRGPLSLSLSLCKPPCRFWMGCWGCRPHWTLETFAVRRLASVFGTQLMQRREASQSANHGFSTTMYLEQREYDASTSAAERFVCVCVCVWLVGWFRFA